MGNRAVITTKENFESNGVGVYLHWNGGYDSVSAFLKYCELKGYRAPDTDCYGWARLCQVIGNFFGGTLSVGIDTVNKLDCDNWDNGVYIIKGWEVVDRKYFKGVEQMNNSMEDMLMGVDTAMPKEEQIGEYIQAEEIQTKDLKIGDMVFVSGYDEKFVKYHVMGFGGNKLVNGTKVEGKPYVNAYGGYYEYKDNINNYILTETVKVAKGAIELVTEDIEE